ncbi:MAG: hypothetical protein Athens071416_142 [Parcubacteria group bacterium Athens0714_16]|nr:MAG: hypothetical protein Athens071416_142 [Parcubacteria group bacterium Athens0714_16]
MKNFGRDNRSSGGGKKFGGRNSGERSFGGRNERGGGGFDNRKEKMDMFKTTCSECGNACEVPFKPTGDKPVYCSDCFRNKGGNSELKSGPKRFGGRDSGKSSFGEKKMYSTVCSGCGNRCEVPFQPTNGKPVYCSNCFEKNDNGGNKNTDQFQKQFEILNTKLDKILKSLSPEVSKEIIDTKKPIKKVETPKIKKTVKKVSKKK